MINPDFYGAVNSTPPPPPSSLPPGKFMKNLKNVDPELCTLFYPSIHRIDVGDTDDSNAAVGEEELSDQRRYSE